MRGSKLLGVFLVVAVICTVVVFVIEERNYKPEYKEFEIIETDMDGAVNLNTATKDELMSLDGVGEKTAERIIEYRDKVRKFESIYDLKEIDGIGDKLFDDNKRLITVE